MLQRIQGLMRLVLGIWVEVDFSIIQPIDYGAFYWSGSGDSNADTNMLFIDFWYSLNTNVPINVGTLNTNNGMFVRCVRSEK